MDPGIVCFIPGAVKMVRSCGMGGFKNAKKGTNIAAQATGIAMAVVSIHCTWYNNCGLPMPFFIWRFRGIATIAVSFDTFLRLFFSALVCIVVL